ncbi:MAG TPA: 3-dehydroquinate synthase [Polyangiaceae bacterium]|nr:3-dehydroquinate synthase [Polyangiaceae bacterium]
MTLAVRTVEQRIVVRLDYPVVFTEDVLAPEQSVLSEVIGRLEPHKRQRCFFVIDDGVARAWPHLTERIRRYVLAHAERLELVGEPLVVPGGEACKNDARGVDRVHRAVHELKLDRHATIVVIGGGAVLDMVGYAAATAHRGVRLVRLPTTVLGQNDSGVGVKNGINAFGKKNFLGCFQAPFAVVNDAAFLSTLSDRDRRAGMAEAVKVALIRDAAFFAWLEQHAPELRRFEPRALAELVERGARLHLEHIRTSGDPFELGTARPLDFGHWSAHKLESLTDFELRHGEAVAIGVALDTLYSVRAGHLRAAEGARVLRLLEELGLPIWHPALELGRALGRRAVLQGLEEFREHLGGELTLTLLAAIGAGFEVHELDLVLLEACFLELQRRAAREAPPAAEAIAR